MQKILLTLVAMAALCSWSLAWASPQWGQRYPAQQTYPGNQAQNVQITNGPTIQNVTPNSAVISWSTNTGSSAVVHYGTDPNNLTQMAQAPWSNGMHTVSLSNLQPGTTYYFQVESAQGQGTGTGELSSISQFRTPTQNMGSGSYGYQGNQGYGYATGGNGNAQNAQITQGPVVEFVSDNSAVIAWSTNVPANTVVKYGMDPNNLTQTAEAPWGKTTHRVNITGLQPNTTYYLQVESAQAQGTGTGALSSVSQFQTVAPGAAPKHYQH